MKQYTRDQLLALYLPSTEVIDVPEDLPFLSATSLSPASFESFDMQDWIKQWQSQKSTGKNNRNAPHTPNHNSGGGPSRSWEQNQRSKPQEAADQWKRGEKVDLVKDQDDLWDDVLEEEAGVEGASPVFERMMGLEDMAAAAEKFRLEMNKMHGKTDPDISIEASPPAAPVFGAGLLSDSSNNNNNNNSNVLSQSQLDTFASFRSLSVENVMQGAVKTPSPSPSSSAVDNKTPTASQQLPGPWEQQVPLAPVEDVWFYLDPQGNQQGMFKSSEMRDWFEAGYFKPNLPIRKGHSGVFTPLAALFVNGQSPFALSSSPLASSNNNSNNFGQLFQQDAQEQQHQMERQRRAQQQQLEMQKQEQQRQLEMQEQQRRAQQQQQQALEQQQQQMQDQQRQMMEQQRVLEQQRQQQLYLEQQAQAQRRQMMEAQIQSEQQHRLKQQQQMEETLRLEQQKILRQQQQQQASSNASSSFGWGLGGVQVGTTESSSSPSSSLNPSPTAPQPQQSQPSWGTVPLQKGGSLKEIQAEEAIAAAKALKKELQVQQQLEAEAAAQAKAAPVTMAERLALAANQQQQNGPAESTNLANMGAQLKMMLGVAQPPPVSSNKQPQPTPSPAVATTNGWNNPPQAVMAVKKTMKEILEEEEQARREQVGKSNNGGSLMPVSKSSKWASIVTGGGGSSSTGLIPSSQQKLMLAQKPKPQPTQILKKQPVTSETSSPCSEDATFWNFESKAGVPSSATPVAPASTPAAAAAAAPQTNEFMNWVSMRIKKLGGMEDTSLMTFCASLEDPTEIREYIAGYLGSTPAVSAFATEFIQRKKLIKSKKQTTSASTVAGSSSTSGKNKRRSKKKGQKLDASLLGFSRVPSSNRPNQGEIDYGN